MTKEKVHKQKIITTRRKVKAQNELNSSKQKKIRGIRTKLICAFLLPVCLFIVVGYFTYSKSQQGLKDTSESLTYTSVNMLKEYFDLGFDSIELTATRIGVNSAVNSYFGGMYDTTYESDAKHAIIVEAVADKYIQDIIAFGKMQENSISNTGIVRKKGIYDTFVKSDACQYVEEHKNQGSCWIGSHEAIDDLIGVSEDDYSLSYVKELLDSSNQQTGYIIIDIKKSFIKEILDNAKVGKNSIKGFITTDGREVISGSDTFSFIDKDFYKDIVDKEEGGYKYIKYNGKSYLFLYDKTNSQNGIVCTMIPKSVIVEKAEKIKWYTVLAIIASCVIAFVVGSILAMGISKAITKINQVMKQTAEGDLTGVITMKRNDEFRILSNNIGNMIKSIKNLIIKVTDVSAHVRESSKQVNDNSNVLFSSSKEITESIGDIELGLIQQSKDTENCLNQMSDLANRISKVYEKTGNIESIASKTQTTVDDGMIIVSKLGERVLDTTKITKNIVHDITELENESRAINSIISTINDIADETNLLSLNASIEAARAGEAGKGFAVVSDQIRKLAEQSSDAGTKISEIIIRIQNQMSSTINTAKRADDIVNDQVEALNTTVRVFNNIKEHVTTLANDLDTISTNMTGIESVKNDTLDAIASISATSNETEAASSELSKNAEKQLEAVEELNLAVKQLQDNSAKLDASISLFKID